MTHQITVELTTGNDAFESNESLEVARIIRAAANDIARDGLQEGHWGLRDINGNRVGELCIAKEE